MRYLDCSIADICVNSPPLPFDRMCFLLRSSLAYHDSIICRQSLHANSPQINIATGGALKHGRNRLSVTIQFDIHARSDWRQISSAVGRCPSSEFSRLGLLHSSLLSVSVSVSAVSISASQCLLPPEAEYRALFGVPEPVRIVSVASG